MAEPELAEPKWALAVEPVPLSANLERSMTAPLVLVTGDTFGVPKLFQRLRDRQAPFVPIVTVEDLRNKITWNELQSVARGAVTVPTLKTLGRLLVPPSGFEWPKEMDLGSQPAKRKRGGSGNNKPTMTLEQQLAAEGVEPLNSATFRFNSSVVFEGIPKKGEAVFIDAYTTKLFDQMWLAQNEIPQLRTYLRPPSIRNAVFNQIAEELPPLSEEVEKKVNKAGKVITLDFKYAHYESNRRNQAKPLKRLAVTSGAAEQLDASGAMLAKQQKLSQVLTVIDLEQADPQTRAASEQRTQWLAKVKAEPVLKVELQAGEANRAAADPAAVVAAAADAAAAATRQVLQEFHGTAARTSSNVTPGSASTVRRCPAHLLPARAHSIKTQP